MTTRRIAITTGVLGAMLLAPSDSGAYSVFVKVEAVGDYSFRYGNTGGNTDAVTEGGSFYNYMTAGGTGYGTTANGSRAYYDPHVWAQDFYDPDLTGEPSDNDTYFDGYGDALSMFVGHGQCDDVTSISCHTDYDCPAGSYCPGGLPNSQGNKACIAQKARWLLTSSPSSTRSNNVFYGTTYGQPASRSLALGESPSTAGWNIGAGSNYGTNVAVIINSCGFRSRYVDSETTYAFAGLHALLGTMPTATAKAVGTIAPIVDFSDTRNYSDRGVYFSYYILQNQNLPLGDAWGNPTLTNNGFNTQIGMANPEGANIVVGRGPTQANAQYHAFTETWNQSRDDANDGTGLGWIYYRYACNYNCNGWGL